MFFNNYSIRMQSLKVRMQNIIQSLIHFFNILFQVYNANIDLF